MIARRLAAGRRPLSWYHLGRACRLLSSGAGAGGDDTQQAVKVFDRAAKRSQRDRAADADWEGEFDYLREHIASALVDRIEASTKSTRLSALPPSLPRQLLRKPALSLVCKGDVLDSCSDRVDSPAVCT